jgi:spore coat protein CotH
MSSSGLALSTDDLFDGNTLHEVRITTHPADWQRLRNNFLDDTYYPAVFEWRGMIVEDIGIRSRGNGSRSAGKPGLKVDFNQFVEGQEFLGLKSLVLDNLTQDQTMIAERLGLMIFQAIGLPAPRVVHARLIVNNVYAGLYTIVEPVDKAFLKRNLGEDGGYLYDYEWTTDYNFEYLGGNPASYSPSPFQPQTNEKNPNPQPIVDFIRILNTSPDSEFVNAVSPYRDLTRLVEYLAVETFIAEPDGIAGDWGLNNFYFYRLQGQNLSIFIPWDKDVTFREAFRSIWHNTERNVLTRRALAVPEVREHYLASLDRVIEVSGGLLEQEIERQAEQIREAAAEDPNRPYTYSEFEEGIGWLRHYAFERPRFLIGEIAESRASQ